MSKPKSPKSKSPKNKDGGDSDDDVFDLDNLVKEKSLSSGQTVFYFTIALFLSALPAYLYNTVYDMTLMENGILFVVITIANSVLLMFSYRNIADSANATLANQRRGQNVSHKSHGYTTKGELEAVKVAVTEREAVAWSLFVNNTLFLLTFLFLCLNWMPAYQIQL